MLKLDIRGFFMSIPRNRLWERLKPFILERYREQDLGRVLKVTERIVLLDASEGCRVAGSLVDWRGLPPDKSLFHTDAGCGLPIGNLTSQVFANFYLHALDEFIKENLGFTRFGRYVDDFFIVEGSRVRLKNAVGRIEAFLEQELALKLHPNKRWLQHATKGWRFWGRWFGLRIRRSESASRATSTRPSMR